MQSLQITLTSYYYKFLSNYLRRAKLPAFNYKRLVQELKNVKIVKADSLPQNVVAVNRRVLLWNMIKNQIFSIDIVAAKGL